MERFDQFTTTKLNLTPRSDAELRNAISNFEQKWQHKAMLVHGGSERIARH